MIHDYDHRKKVSAKKTIEAEPHFLVEKSAMMGMTLIECAEAPFIFLFFFSIRVLLVVRLYTIGVQAIRDADEQNMRLLEAFVRVFLTCCLWCLLVRTCGK